MIRTDMSSEPCRAGRHRSPRHRGFTIIEVLILITILAFVLGAAVIQMQLLMKLDQDGRLRIEQSTVWERLGRQLRRDVHEASLAEPFTEKQTSGLRVLLSGPSPNRVEYRIDRKEIIRTETGIGRQVSREVYSAPHMIEARFEARGESSRRLIALILTRTVAKARDVPPRVDEIVAAVPTPRSKDGSNRKGAGG